MNNLKEFKVKEAKKKSETTKIFLGQIFELQLFGKGLSEKMKATQSHDLNF